MTVIKGNVKQSMKLEFHVLFNGIVISHVNYHIPLLWHVGYIFEFEII